MYGVMLLMFVVYLRQRTAHPDKPILSAVALGVMASVDTIGIILSFVLLLEYAYTALPKRRTSPLFSRRKAISALAVYAAILLFAVWSARPAADISWRTTGRPFADAKDMPHLYEALLRYTIFPFFPVQSPRSHFFWNPLLHYGSLTYTIIMLVTLGVLWMGFRRRRNLLLLLGVTILAGTAFGHLVYAGSERQFGIVFLAFLAGMWIIRAEDTSALLPIPVYILLLISALSGAWATIGSWERPFSYNKAAGQWIVANHLENMPLVGETDTSVIGIAEYLHRPIYQIECACVDTYMLFSSRRDDFNPISDPPRRILQASHFYHDAPLLYVRAFPLKQDEEDALKQEGFQVQPLASFTGAEELAENFYFFRLTLTDAAGNGTAATSPKPAP